MQECAVLAWKSVQRLLVRRKRGMKDLRGVMAAMVTPFDRSGALNLGALPGYLEFQRAAGMDGLVVSGTNGEAVSMSVEERQRLLEAVLERRGDLVIVAGTGAASVTDALALTRHAAAVGADAALVLPPFFFKNPSAQGVADYFRRVLDAAELPVLLYSIPQFSGVAITDEVLALLDGHPRLAGLKDSAGQWERTYALITGRRDLKVFPGSDGLLAPSLVAGAAGSITGTANAFPDLIVAVKRAHDAGRDTTEAQARLDAAKNILVQYPLISSIK